MIIPPKVVSNLKEFNDIFKGITYIDYCLWKTNTTLGQQVLFLYVMP